MKEEIVTTGERSVLLPLFVGAAVGAGIALLLAPKPGRELRKQIQELGSDSKEKILSTVDRGKALYEEGKAAISSAVDAGKHAYEQEKEKHFRKAA
jgi:gas vesicle protein